MSAETIDIVIASAVLVIEWISITVYMLCNYRKPCKWRINYWR